MKGYIQVYTGNGKGKTTAALGLAIRAAGAGLKVFIAQFCKGLDYSELKSLNLLKENIKVKQYGKSAFIHGKRCEEDKRLAIEGLKASKEAIESGKYDVIIRSINSKDARTATVTKLPIKLLNELKEELIKIPETKFIYFDVTPKPPATIEYV